jgi:predicted lipid-binding transport protein (Tim44 family)
MFRPLCVAAVIAAAATDALARAGGGCFVPGTPVLLADGRERPIGEVRPGDMVLAFGPDGSVTPAPVVECPRRPADGLLELRTAAGRVALVTAEHPFRTPDGDFRPAGSLRPGDALCVWDGAAGLAADAVASVTAHPGPAEVCNLTVDGPHTFFAAGIAVHNKGGGGGGGSRGGGGGFSGGGSGGGRSWSGSRSRGYGSGLGWSSPWSWESRLVVVGLLGAGAFALGAMYAGWKVGAGGALAGMATGGVFTAVDPVLALFIGAIAVSIALQHFRLLGGRFAGMAAAWSGTADSVLPRRAVDAKASATAAALRGLVASTGDAGWDPDRLAAHARETFLLLQQCWQARDYGPVRGRVMPDLARRHSAQLAAMRRQGETNVLADLSVEAVDPVHVRAARRPEDDSVTFLITARARDHYVDDRTGAFLRGDRSPRTFQEFWMFQRSGADGAGGWRVADIEQVDGSDLLSAENVIERSGPSAGVSAPMAGLLEKAPEPPSATAAPPQRRRLEARMAELAGSDPAWRPEAVKELARRLFVDVLLAEQSGDPAAVPADGLSPEAAADLRDRLRARAGDGVRIEYRNLCVRRADVSMVRPGAGLGGGEVIVRVLGHAAVTVRRGDRTLRADPDVTPLERTLTLVRSGGPWRLTSFDDPGLRGGAESPEVPWTFPGPRVPAAA